MTSRRKHRGAHPADGKLFDDCNLPVLREAVSDLSWLLTHGYAPVASLKLVGDRYELKARQRLAASRAACSDQQRTLRSANRIELNELKGQKVLIDGFNLLITIEAALSGGLLLQCRDGLIRDLSSVHGSYRTVDETEKAVLLIGAFLDFHRIDSAEWLLDKPVSNSGRLASSIRQIAEQQNWPWRVTLHLNPDKLLQVSDSIIITSDSNILDASPRWINTISSILGDHFGRCWMVDLSSFPFVPAASGR